MPPSDNPPLPPARRHQYNPRKRLRMTHPPTAEHPWQQIFWLLILAIPIACIARTVVFEELFRELRDYCTERSQTCRTKAARKFFYLFICEYCFSHYVTIAILILTALGPGPGFRMLMPD